MNKKSLSSLLERLTMLEALKMKYKTFTERTLELKTDIFV